jgi:hypothetical protein
MNKDNFVGVSSEMPGTGGGFTMATFTSKDVPPGTKLYIKPQSDNDSILVSRGALQVAISMLRRDAEEGFKVRGELAEELANSI